MGQSSRSRKTKV